MAPPNQKRQMQLLIEQMRAAIPAPSALPDIDGNSPATPTPPANQIAQQPASSVAIPPATTAPVVNTNAQQVTATTVQPVSPIVGASSIATDAQVDIAEQKAVNDYEYNFGDATKNIKIRANDPNFNPEDEIMLYSAIGGVESTKYLRVLFVDNDPTRPPPPISSKYLDRISLCEVIEERKKRPRARIVFDFNSPRAMNGTSNIDAIIEQIPLDARMYIDLGYANQFVRFGEFEVIEHDISVEGGGVSITVLLESFARMRHYTGYRVFTSGRVIDVLRELYNRHGLNIDDESFEQAIDLIYTGIQGGDLRSLLEIDPNDPFVQTGESDLEFARRLTEFLGLSSVLVDQYVRFMPLFSPNRGKNIVLRHGSIGANVRSITFKSRKPRVNFIREVYKQAQVSSSVKKKGPRTFGAPPTATNLKVLELIPKPVEPNYAGMGSIARNNAKDKYERELAEYNNAQALLKESESITLTGDTADALLSVPTVPGAAVGALKAEIANSTSTKAQTRAKGRILGRIRRRGRVLSGNAELLTGSVVVTLAHPLRVDIGSKLYDDIGYQVDMIRHTIDDTGFNTTIGFTREQPKALAKATSTPTSNVTFTSPSTGVTAVPSAASTTQVPVTAPVVTPTVPTQPSMPKPVAPPNAPNRNNYRSIIQYNNALRTYRSTNEYKAYSDVVQEYNRLNPNNTMLE